MEKEAVREWRKVVMAVLMILLVISGLLMLVIPGMILAVTGLGVAVIVIFLLIKWNFKLDK